MRRSNEGSRARQHRVPKTGWVSVAGGRVVARLTSRVPSHPTPNWPAAVPGAICVCDPVATSHDWHSN
jgi:hypothetical protein